MILFSGKIMSMSFTVVRRENRLSDCRCRYATTQQNRLYSQPSANDCCQFLCKYLPIDWRWGEAYFAQKLNDCDLSANNGNWQWAAGSGCDAATYFRVFNPALQTEKFDKKFEYIMKWLPEYGTENYPKPMVEHCFARERVLNVYGMALKEKQY